MFIYFWDNARDRVQAAEGQTEGDTESEAGSRPGAVSPEPDAGPQLTNHEIMTWAEVGRLTDRATRAPLDDYILRRSGSMLTTTAGIGGRVWEHRVPAVYMKQ